MACFHLQWGLRWGRRLNALLMRRSTTCHRQYVLPSCSPHMLMIKATDHARQLSHSLSREKISDVFVKLSLVQAEKMHGHEWEPLSP